jgi:hypothetical protein
MPSVGHNMLSANSSEVAKQERISADGNMLGDYSSVVPPVLEFLVGRPMRSKMACCIVLTTSMQAQHPHSTLAVYTRAAAVLDRCSYGSP